MIPGHLVYKPCLCTGSPSKMESHNKVARGGAKAGAPQPRQPAPARNYMVTINFPVDHKGTYKHVPRMLDCSLWDCVKYCIYQFEFTEPNNLHIQGYLECSGTKTWGQLHQLPGLEHAHFERRRGSQHDAIRYVTKRDETYLEGPWEYGEPARQGARSDLLEIQIKIANKVPMKQIAEENFGSFIRHGRMFKEYRRITSEQRRWKTIVWLIIGPSGRGKSNFADSMARAIGTTMRVPPKKGSGMYFDDYDGQECIIIEEMNGDKFTPEFFNELCDRYPLTIPFHGTAGAQMLAKHLFITTNYHPKFWWKKRNANQIYQTMRRIDIVWKAGFVYNKPYVHEAFQAFGPNINRPNVDPNIVPARDPNDDSLWPDVPPLEEGLAIE